MTTGVSLCCVKPFVKVSLESAAEPIHCLLACRSHEHAARAPAASPFSSGMPTAFAAPVSSSLPANQAQPAMIRGTQQALAKRCSLPLSRPAAALGDRQPPTRQGHRASNLAETAVCARLSGTSSYIAVEGCTHLSCIPFAGLQLWKSTWH